MSTINKLNEFLATSVAAMDDVTLRAWNVLSDFEKQFIAAGSFYFKENINSLKRKDEILKLKFKNVPFI